MTRGIKPKILSIVLLIVVLLCVNSIWAITNFTRLSSSIDDIMQSNYNSIIAAQHMNVALERQDSAQLTYIFTNDSKAKDTFFENQQIFLKWLSRAEDNITEKGEKEVLENISNHYTQYINSFSSLLRTQSSSAALESQNYYYNEIFPKFERLKSECRKLENINQQAMVGRKDKAHEISKQAIFSTILISVATVITGIVSALYLGNRIVEPIHSLIEKTKNIASGDYSQRLSVVGGDEISRLSREFNTMTSKLQYYELLNINNLMKEKQKAEAIVESISDGVLVTDENNKFILINKAAEQALNVKEKDVINKHFLQVIKKQEIFEVIDKIQKNKDSEEYKNHFDITINKEDKTKYYRLYVKPIIDEEDKISGTVTLMQDITKFKELDQIKSDFVSTVSHEFRTPLTSIIMGTGLLLEEIPGKVNEDQKELLDAIKEDGNRLQKLVSELLDLSRIESGKIQMNIQNNNIKEIIEYALRPFYIQAEEKNINIKLDIENKIPNVKADYDKISWVITNLVGNAFRYTPRDGSGIIQVKAKLTGNKMLIGVSDNGTGIPKEYQQNIFEKFVQIKGESEDRKGSAGLGLAISKEIINAHGGDIWVKSKLNEGSTFYFTLNIEG